jgi:hypothetical protein
LRRKRKMSGDVKHGLWCGARGTTHGATLAGLFLLLLSVPGNPGREVTFSAASWSAVFPTMFAAVVDAPRSRRILATSGWPFCAAKWSAVFFH